MDTVSHRDMRNHSGEILRRVAAGESVQISNNGRLAAIIVPPASITLDGLVARGEARAARQDTSTLTSITRSRSSISTRDLIEDSRGTW
ncbi:prevent-host-death family protein [Leifsonia sp. AK011]|uniref:type II toxin-antitoxin system Phd/YefM family antitoxin n=1 Tax=Leifsonia sp. AK011 TaxID=2723075 RepID=UPI0015C9A01D|nr:type II toxin-antitoxin system prevent-host-death family antitoxin [Leifsonia sp. AK011]NYF09753.1 prevent-host-death family protein [Leifsonia sp. AK011]